QNQNAEQGSFHDGSTAECANEPGRAAQADAPTETERWRREYNQHRPKKAIGAMTPATYAQQLANSEIIPPGL
ncbi:transposase, partial [Xanthomonas oryzae pv. oryzae]|uniref:integrase core domain-containing protein n=1 Tax=Xanthomonas oryzae TaxID=347 RepID=UPI000968DE5B